MHKQRGFACTRFAVRRLLLLLPCALVSTQFTWAQPANDDCANRITIGEGATPFSTIAATTDGPGFPLACEDGLDDQCYNDIWYEITPQVSGNMLVSTCDQADYDTDLVVYDGTDCNSLVLLGCNDDDPACQTVLWTSQVTVPVTAGQGYLIRVGGWGPDDFGTGTLTVTVIADPEICDNGIDDDLDGLIDCDDPDCADFIDCLVEICDNGEDDDLDGLVDCEDPDCEALFPCLQCPASTFGDVCVLNQSGDTETIESSNTTACGISDVGTAPNGWARCFDLTAEGATDDVTIDSVTFGVQEATIDGINVNVNLYLDENGCADGPNEPGVDAVLIASEATIVNTADVGMLLTVPITSDVAVGPGDYLWVEIEQVDDGTVDPKFSFRPGGNTGDECGASYLRAESCGLIPWIDLADIGFPDANLILVIECTAAGAEEVALDIKPGSCPNPVNARSHGFIPMALTGSGDFDVLDVDIASLTLSRADGNGGSVMPWEGPPGPHTEVGDVATPFDGGACECAALDGDGTDDLIMHFATPQVVAALELFNVPGGEDLELCVSGTLLDGTPFDACDCILIVPPHGNAAVSANASASIGLSPADLFGNGGGLGDLRPWYLPNTELTATAPATVLGPVANLPAFDHWVVDGVAQPVGQRTITVTVGSWNQPTVLEAVYRWRSIGVGHLGQLAPEW